MGFVIMPNLRLRKQDEENHLFPDDPLGLIVFTHNHQDCRIQKFMLASFKEMIFHFKQPFRHSKQY